METAIIVPARLASSRFPQKLLYEVRGRPVLLWTARRIREQTPEYPLFFAVDSERLATLLAADGFESVLTDPDLPSGTDRIAAANATIGASRVINVQGDEPMVTAGQIHLLDRLLGPGIDMATLGLPLADNRDYHDPNHVKMVCGKDGRALYFSRAPIPYIRDTQGRYDAAVAGADSVLIHVGLYAYTSDFLAKFAQLPPGRLEQLEKLEMLRVLENGYNIATGITRDRLVEIDTVENIQEFEETTGGAAMPGN